ncbi:tRNA pseudouridine38-40 synthase [Clostridium grantii DSM 8605]|uniref:tRNA pseudouridine synthase A n=1 Tax=Clostridium grantii DSM 8605 TaxID=1121316 RepID=A0A1M5TTF1_9CLOT|nr:tRNA pseudouridine38-40 synthase [Clostridium grantii DSM 8605]
MIKNIKLKIEYDGTNYAGWQRQINANTVQLTLEKAIGKVVNEDVNLIGVSRTDTGVHAKEYIANFSTNSTIPAKKMMHVINNHLPGDIAILSSEQVEPDFHSRYSSKGKIYSYTINNRQEKVALNRAYAYHYKYPLNIELMKEASKYFLGEHDFSSFRNKGSHVVKTVKNIYQLDILKQEDNVIIYVYGDGFLYNMVRIMVGTLIDVGRERIKPDRIKDILLAKDRKCASKTAPSSGLCLEKVFY